ncbi:hypothetical protein BBP40_008878 [Aspergillus hancockii]|nr:hypothetical protein BBP40_008878 [Aspergillus hancockii]
MDLTFHISQDGKVPKRKYTRGACERCRHRKAKRQPESPLSLSRDDNFIQYSPNVSPGARSPVSASPSQRVSGGSGLREQVLQSEQESSRLHMDSQQNGSQLSARTNSARRFIGDLNPVVLFVDDASTRLLRGRANQRDCGEWLDDGNELLGQGENSSRDELSSDSAKYQHLLQRRHSRRTRALLPPRQSQNALVNIYFRRIHPILPLIDEHDFRAQLREDNVSPHLLQAICLVSSKEQDAEPFLRLANRSETLSLRKFSHLLYEDLSHAIAIHMERKRMTLIQILALLSLHASGSTSFENTSIYLAQAIHHAQTLGLHLPRCAPAGNDKHSVMLFWCLWSLDRWSAALHGRPLVIHDIDLGQQVTDVIHLFDSPFRLWLSLASIIDEVMVVYRPAVYGPVDENKPEIPRFEEVVENCRARDIPLDAMCFSVAYKQLKRCQLPSTQYNAKQHLHAFYKCLETLSPIWWSAQVMTRLGRRAFGGMQRVAESTNQLSVPNTSHRKGYMGVPPSDSGACNRNSTTVLQPEDCLPEEVEAARDQPLSTNEPVPIADNHLSWEFADLGSGGFGDYTEDPMFQDIDDLLGNFLNINVPKCPSNSTYINPDTTWIPEELDCPNLY